MNRSGGGRSTDQGSGNYKSGRVVVTSSHGHSRSSEKERLSVFDRLGTRRDMNTSSSGGGGSHYSSTATDYVNKGKKSLASSVVPVRRPPTSERSVKHGTSLTSSNQKYDQAKHSNYDRKSRTKSSSPKSKRGVGAGVTSSTTSRKGRADYKTGPANKYKKEPSGARRELSGKSKLKAKDPDGYKQKEKTKSSSKLKKQRAKLKSKIRASSTTESSSKGESTSSKSESSSTSISEASSSTLSESSSSDSSAPSIKLKTGKGKRGSGGSVVPAGKDKRVKEILSGKPIGSSSSSIVSTKYDYKNSAKGVGRGNSSPNAREREHDRDRERRSGAVTSSVEHYRRSRDPGSPGREREQYSRKDNFESSSRKRKHSGDSYGSTGKRTRRITPSPGRYKSSGRHSLTPRRIISPEVPQGKRRYTPESQALKRIPSPELYTSKLRRERSPPPLTMPERIRIIKTTEKHPFYEGDQRREDRYLPGSKDLRGSGSRQYPPYGGIAYDSSKEKRPRERLAPARSSSPVRGRPIQSPSHQNFEGPPGRRAPLLPFPPGVEAQRFGFQQQQHRDFPPAAPSVRPGSMQSHPRKQGPLIVKTKEALIQKYDDGKSRPTRVDKWVDETVTKDHNRPALLPTPTFAPYKHPPTIKTEEPPAKQSVLTAQVPQTPDKVSDVYGKSVVKQEIIEEDLSDFSDDAEQLLNEEIENKDNQGKVQLKEPDKSIKCEAMDVPVKIEQESTTIPISDSRDLRSNTGTHTDDDILERLDFEEISDDELGETEHKVGIIDALGVDWSSLITTEKTKNESSPSLDNVEEGGKKLSLRERCCPANRFKETGLSRKLFGDTFFNKIYGEIQALEEKCGIDIEERTTEDELEFPSLRHKRLAKKNFMKKVGLVSSNTAFTRHRDEALRRFLLDLPPEPIGSRFKEFPHVNPTDEDEENDADIFQRSIAAFKASAVKTNG